MSFEDEPSAQVARQSMLLHIEGRPAREGYVYVVNQSVSAGLITTPLPPELAARGVVVGPDHAEALLPKVGQRVSVLYEAVAYWAILDKVETGSDYNRVDLIMESFQDTPPLAVSHTQETSDAIVSISKWISASYPEGLDQEAHDWRRLMKYREERGEVVDAFYGLHGENPRKGSTHTRQDVLKELFDVAGAALGAASYWTGDDGTVMAEFRKHMLRTALRNGLIRNPFLPEKPADGQHVWSDGPSDIGGNHRCKLCGAYRGSVEGERKCEGEFKESGKMRVWARDRWEKSISVD